MCNQVWIDNGWFYGPLSSFNELGFVRTEDDTVYCAALVKAEQEIICQEEEEDFAGIW